MADSGHATLRRVKRLMLATDLGLLLYWAASAAGLLSAGEGEWMADWNWSFFGLDLLAVATGLASLGLARTGHRSATTVMTVSLALTSAAGLVAVNFWALRGDFDAAWWIPNLWLLLFPVAALLALGRSTPAANATTGPAGTPGTGADIASRV